MPAEPEKTSLVEDVRLMFELASLQREAARKLSADDWRELQTINESHEGRRQAVEQNFELTYDERLTAARQRLIDEAGAKRLDYKPRWLGRDRFDRQAIDREARLQVRQDYRGSLDHIDREEARKIEGLLARAEQKNKAREVPLRDFARATDRRGGPDRRRRN